MLMAADMLALLKEAMDSRAPDYANIRYPGWPERTFGTILKAEGRS